MPCKCLTCGKTFSRPENLTRHQVLHNADEPFECHKCGSRFKLQEYLSKHIGKNLNRKSCLTHKRKYIYNPEPTSTRDTATSGQQTRSPLTTRKRTKSISTLSWDYALDSPPRYQADSPNTRTKASETTVQAITVKQELALEKTLTQSIESWNLSNTQDAWKKPLFPKTVKTEQQAPWGTDSMLLRIRKAAAAAAVAGVAVTQSLRMLHSPELLNLTLSPQETDHTLQTGDTTSDPQSPSEKLEFIEENAKMSSIETTTVADPVPFPETAALVASASPVASPSPVAPASPTTPASPTASIIPQALAAMPTASIVEVESIPLETQDTATLPVNIDSVERASRGKSRSRGGSSRRRKSGSQEASDNAPIKPPPALTGVFEWGGSEESASKGVVCSWAVRQEQGYTHERGRQRNNVRVPIHSQLEDVWGHRVVILPPSSPQQVLPSVTREQSRSQINKLFEGISPPSLYRPNTASNTSPPVAHSIQYNNWNYLVSNPTLPLPPPALSGLRPTHSLSPSPSSLHRSLAPSRTSAFLPVISSSSAYSSSPTIGSGSPSLPSLSSLSIPSLSTGSSFSPPTRTGSLSSSSSSSFSSSSSHPWQPVPIPGRVLLAHSQLQALHSSSSSSPPSSSSSIHPSSFSSIRPASSGSPPSSTSPPICGANSPSPPCLPSLSSAGKVVEKGYVFVLADGHEGAKAARYFVSHLLSATAGALTSGAMSLRTEMDRERAAAWTKAAFLTADRKYCEAEQRRRSEQHPLLYPSNDNNSSSSSSDVQNNSTNIVNGGVHPSSQTSPSSAPRTPSPQPSLPSGGGARHDGCTLVLVVVAHGHILTAHLGDSRAIILTRLGQRWELSHATKDHSLSDPRVAEMVAKRGGIVKRHDQGLRLHLPTDENGVTRHLGVAASLGDFGAKAEEEGGVCVVANVPDISFTTLPAPIAGSNKAPVAVIVMGTDGFWECAGALDQGTTIAQAGDQNQWVASRFAHQLASDGTRSGVPAGGNSPQDVLSTIYNEAWQGEQLSLRRIRDDSSALTLFLYHAK